MSDLPSSLGIEAVECLSEGGRSVTVRVTGRWRRRRPELRGQAMLVVEAEGGRQRFLAMPEPPSLTGAAPGTWRMSFSLPAALAPQLPGRTFLQLGGVMVPLPIGEVAVAGAGAEDPDPDLLEARRLRSSELAAESARRRAAEADRAAAQHAARVEQVERELSQARAESDRLRSVIAAGERRLRAAGQDVHSERALRAEVEQELARRARAAEHDLRALHERVADLERELVRMRRAVDEAQHLAAAAEAARADAERRLAQRPSAAPAEPAGPAQLVDRPRERVVQLQEPAERPPARPLGAELALARAAPAVTPTSRQPLVADRAGDRAALRHESAMAEHRGGRADAEQRAAALERELAETRRDLDEQRRRSARAYEAIELVRAELRQIRATAAATGPTAGSGNAAEGPVPAPGSVQAEQLSAALARLRERNPVAPVEEAGQAAPAEAAAAEPAPAEPPLAEPSPAEPPPAGRASKPWLAKAFRALAAQDPSAAGRLLLALLPAQPAADPHPVAYDLVVGDLVCAHVTVASGAARVEVDDTARPLSEVDFQLVGDLAGIARLLAAGPMRRRLRRLPSRRRLARIRGDRRRLAALDRLLGAPLTLRELHDAGVRLDPLPALTVAALMIESGWTAGERFTIGHREAAAPSPDAYLHVRDGRPLLAMGEAPHGPVSTVVVCPADELLGVLAGAVGDGVKVAGDQRPVALVRQWLDRAQCG